MFKYVTLISMYSKDNKDYLENFIETYFIIFFSKFGFEYSSPKHFIDKDKLNSFLGENQNKEFFLVTDKRMKSTKLLRPDLTLVILEGNKNKTNKNLQNTHLIFFRNMFQR